jgi:diadenosine tetraphosphate (Ap4A) HIT family hydrolase
MREIHELSDADQLQLLHESVLFSRVLEQTFHPDKLNIAALGNVVPQLHIHHIVRYQDDAAWPNPVWGVVPALAYEQQEREALIGRLLAQMPESFVPSAKLTV